MHTKNLEMDNNIHYHAIQEFYGNQKAQRSQVPLINHINEGLAILDILAAPLEAKEAFCLHPLLQQDNDLLDSLTNNQLLINNKLNNSSVILAMEYRAMANTYLLPNCTGPKDEIKLSLIEEVNLMLVADKVQNRKDFEIYHQKTHNKSDILAVYFNNWLRVLGISEARYQHLVELIKNKV